MSFHWQRGWMFQRQENGDVKFWNTDIGVHAWIVPEAEWISIVSEMSASPRTSYLSFMQLHNKKMAEQSGG